MVICVYGAASDIIDKKYMEAVTDLCKDLGKDGHSLVFGAGATGLMGAAARGFKKSGAYVHGVIPKFFEDDGFEGIFYDADKITRTETMAERKATMENECEAFIIVPGGIGTLEEFYETLTLKQLGRHKKAIVVYNLYGYYDTINQMFDQMVDSGFLNIECRKLFAVLDSKEKVVDYLKNYSSKGIEWDLLKKCRDKMTKRKQDE